ncbi:MAG: UbiA prenyltransferase family protein [Actinomycetota bacterium]|nr:UbiA prenyltransferase family protein [Actinomycetota bacterium]
MTTSESTAREAPATGSLPPGRPTLRGHIAIMRVDHWVKQVFVLPGIVAALSDGTSDVPGGAAGRIVFGMLSVCLVSSSNYVVNEVLDAPSDLSHPVKRNRPVPSGKVNVRLAYVQWIALMVLGVGLGFMVNRPLGFTMAALWVMGCVYNIRPVRSKDLPYLDVLSESINNPLRMLAGWYMVGTDAFAPASLLISYWMVGCFFMAIKRYAEYRDIGDPERASAYRKSFAHYTLERLLVSITFYASASMLFLGAFIMRYRLELVLAFPLIALVMAVYLGLAFKPESAVVNPEKLYREPVLMTAVIACSILMAVLMFVDITALDEIFKPTGLRIRS